MCDTDRIINLKMYKSMHVLITVVTRTFEAILSRFYLDFKDFYFVSYVQNTYYGSHYTGIP